MLVSFNKIKQRKLINIGKFKNTEAPRFVMECQKLPALAFLAIGQQKRYFLIVFFKYKNVRDVVFLMVVSRF